MDLFGKKQQALENVVKAQAKTIATLQDNELSLAADIREMDQLIFEMSQCTSWIGMQPIFAELKSLTDARMVEESRCIQNVLIPEMKKAYLK